MKRIKENIRFACLAALAIGLAACSQDELSPAGTAEGNAVQIGSVSIGSKVETRVSENPADAGKSSVWDFDGTEQIGVRVNNGIKGVYTLNADKSITTTQPTYWTSSGSQTVRAWYPLECDHIDLSNQSAGNLAYALYTAVSGSYASEAPLALNFSHKLAKVRVLLKGDPEAITQIEAKNFASCSLNPIGGAVTGSNESYIPLSRVTYATTDGNKETYWEANLAPGKAGTDVLLLNGKLIQSIQGVTQLESGKMYTVTLNVMASDIVTFEGCTIADWGTKEILGSADLGGQVDADYLIHESGAWWVFTAAGLQAWADHVRAGHYDSDCKLMANIVMPAVPDDGVSYNFTSIGSEANPYTGSFDGNGYTISGLTMAFRERDLVEFGLFGYIDQGEVKNLTINGSLNALYAQYLGAIVGTNKNGKVINCHTLNSSVALYPYRSTTTELHFAVGGIVGCNLGDGGNAYVIGCTMWDGLVYGDYPSMAGGIVGKNIAVNNGKATVVGNRIVETSIRRDVGGRYCGGIVGYVSCQDAGSEASVIGCFGQTYSGMISSDWSYGILAGTIMNDNAAGVALLKACHGDFLDGSTDDVLVGDELSTGTVTDCSRTNEGSLYPAAAASMNAAISEWNADNGNLCQWHFEHNGTSVPPSLVGGAPN